MKRSDWLRWVEGHAWYRRESSSADNYSAVIHHLLHPRENRKDFFLRLINPSVPASQGYERLLDLMDQHRIETVLTTNFDGVLSNLHVMRRRPHYLEIIRTPADYTKFSTSPTHPQFIYLHGSVEHYTDKNLLDEVRFLDEKLVTLLTPLLRDHPLIVIGYRGAEPSIMRHLLSDQCSHTHTFRKGVYWCVLPNEKVHPGVTELAMRLSGNLQLIEIAGFDEVMQSLENACSGLPRSFFTGSSSTSPTGSHVPFDMRVVADADLDELDWARVYVQMAAYFRRMQIDTPDNLTRTWLLKPLEQLDLLRQTAEGWRPTNAGYLMFALNPAKRIAGAFCDLRIEGEKRRILEGNLWSQLDSVSDLLAEINRPFRLKATISEAVYPYPPLALKELLVNALVHRAYDLDEALRIDIDPKFIRLVNPGGLVDAVFQLVSTRLQEQIELGNRGIRGYRNPVIADVFFGAGAMDKEGSGLPDVHDEVMRNEGRVFFGPVDDTNRTFRALIYRRQEEADRTTRTAASAISKRKYFANLLEVVNVPESVYRVATNCRSAIDMFHRIGKDALVPPFVLKRETELIAFANLTDNVGPFAPAIDPGLATSIPTSQLVATSEGRRNFVELLNRSFFRYLLSKTLLVDNYKMRSYFARTEEGPKEITYQASFRQATRTVTKPIISKRTEKVLYWQHEAVAFGFDRFRSEWALHILPGYVFTKDGVSTLLHYSKVGALATRKAARDFNMQVYNDLVFWTWVLAEGRDSFQIELGADSPLMVRGLLLNCELAFPEVADSDASSIPHDKEDAYLARLEREVAEEAESELETAEESDAY